jgi:serine/threonine-protein kinase
MKDDPLKASDGASAQRAGRSAPKETISEGGGRAASGERDTAEGRRAAQGGKATTPRPGGAKALIGSVLSGRYRIDRLLGEGGMGAVYEAEHTHMRKRFAVKVLHTEMSRMPEVVARFEREALAAAHIEHPNVAGATDFGMLDDGSFFLVLEYVEGRSLREVVGEGRLELGRALHITNQIASAVQRAHALGIVHRDLKPENVMLVTKDLDPDFVKVLDFGIAKVPVGSLASEELPASAASGAPKVLTQLGMVYGTPEYMAPEQAVGQSVDARADLYSLGVMLYEMLAGTRPFDHDSKVALLGMHVTARVPPFVERCPEALVPPEVEAIVMRLMKKEADDRFADAKELMEALAQVTGLLVERGRIEPRLSAVSLLGSQSTSSPNLKPLVSPTSAREGAAGSKRGAPNPSAQVTISPLGGRAPLASVDARVNSESGAIRLPNPESRGGRFAPVIATVLAILSLMVVIAVVMGGRGPKKAGAAADGAASIANAAADQPGSSEDDDRIKAALASIDKGDYGTGIATLTTLEPADMGRADVHRALLKAYLATSATADAMREAGLLVKTEPGSATDPKLLEEVRNAALAGGPAADEAFALLESSLGSAGPDILYDLVYTTLAQQYPAAAKRASRALASPDVKTRFNAGLAVAMDLRVANTCEKVKALLPRASDQGGSRALAVLKAYVPNRGCGFLGTRDCWPCIHKDGSLAKAIAAVEDRTAKR